MLTAQRLTVLVVVFMALGTGTELFLIGHFEDAWQWVPILIVGTSLLVFLVRLIKESSPLRRSFQVLMYVSMLSGVVGSYFHIRANFEFEQELHADAAGMPLLVNSLSGALPALAPGSMIVFGLIGILYNLIIQKQTI